MINIRQKGAEGEREIATDLNVQIYMVCTEMGITVPSPPLVQRNQNQSAIGGCDLVGTFGLAIEIKRQEQLSISSWWAQCVKSAATLNEMPVLLFKQSRQPWRCVLETKIQVTEDSTILVRSEISYADFKTFFRERVRRSFAKSPRISQDVGMFA